MRGRYPQLICVSLLLPLATLVLATADIPARGECIDITDWPAPIGREIPGRDRLICQEGGIVRLRDPNIRPAVVLANLDIDGDGLADAALDTDGDGLPDNWELNAGVAPEPPSATRGQVDRFVGFPGPTAVSPGTPPTFVFTRLSVTTAANTIDTDRDGLTDFIEVFGLKYIDDNGNGKLDFIYTDSNRNGRWDEGEEIDPSSEWLDLNGDGLPSIGEYPLLNIDPALGRDHDFDGFVFTDPTNPDTDGDGINDGDDPDPLINPETFGVPLSTGFGRIQNPDPLDSDLDNDGLGNGSDFGNDLIRMVDYPTDIAKLVEIFRPDRLKLDPPTLPESLMEDLIGADWDGNGLYRITDVRDFRRNPTETCLRNIYGPRFEELFLVGNSRLWAEGAQSNTQNACEPANLPAAAKARAAYGARGDALGWQHLLLPADRSVPFLPDVRVWTVLYAWRMPGFDVDGDGYVGSPESSFRVDDLQLFAASGTGSGGTIPNLDGRIEVNCGNAGPLFGLLITLAIAGMWLVRNRRGNG